MKIETYTVTDDITVVYVPAASFPAGIDDAFNKLYSLAGHPDGTRHYFGVSRPEEETGGQIAYKAAASTVGEDKLKSTMPTLVLKKGTYASIFLQDYHKDIRDIGRAFDLLLQQPTLDENGYCVEWYKKGDVRCMVRLES